MPLGIAAQVWPTPLATEAEKNPTTGLTRAFWATPTSLDWRSGKASQQTMERNRRPLSEQVGGQLNPRWVEWLMGFPFGWTALCDSATPWCLTSRRQSTKAEHKNNDGAM
jgi:hypothetical protein